ncbi:MAG: carbohydrate ABC transporter permease [Brevirhabdus sp.]
MSVLRFGYVTGPVLGLLWALVMTTTIAVAMSFSTGEPFRPGLIGSVLVGVAMGLLPLYRPARSINLAVGIVLAFALGFVLPPVLHGSGVGHGAIVALLVGATTGLTMPVILKDAPHGAMTRHEFEEAVIRFLTGFGYVFFTAIVIIPFYVMVMTSLKSQQALLANPLDFSIQLSKGWDLFRSYVELFRDFNFGTYLWTSFMVSVLTVAITLAFSVPGAYAVARLRFRGQAAMSRSILLIYMVPMIVLALPIYIAFSMAGLRNTIVGIVLIYPVTTIPVALYMLQGYFRGLPGEVEEAGLMDGLSRLAVIWKITLPLSLPALASVSLYVFMIAWNEFLLAFMLLDDPSKFTLTRGVAMLNSSEIPRQHLMAGAVIATVPIMVLFLGLEKFMTRGLTAGSVKG